MTSSPGHRKWPDHEVREEPLGDHAEVEVAGEIAAESDDVIRVVESKHPDRLYFPRDDVSATLERSDTTTECPFKGEASYFDVVVGDQRLPDAAWSYEHPYDEHVALASRIAFDDDNHPDLKVVH